VEAHGVQIGVQIDPPIGSAAGATGPRGGARLGAARDPRAVRAIALGETRSSPDTPAYVTQPDHE
jgi:hypothetical protein